MPDVVIVGDGAAGIAGARRLANGGVAPLPMEAGPSRVSAALA